MDFILFLITIFILFIYFGDSDVAAQRAKRDKSTLFSICVLPQVSRLCYLLHILNFSSEGVIRDFLVNYQTALSKFPGPFYS